MRLFKYILAIALICGVAESSTTPLLTLAADVVTKLRKQYDSYDAFDIAAKDASTQLVEIGRGRDVTDHVFIQIGLVQDKIDRIRVDFNAFKITLGGLLGQFALGDMSVAEVLERIHSLEESCAGPLQQAARAELLSAIRTVEGRTVQAIDWESASEAKRILDAGPDVFPGIVECPALKKPITLYGDGMKVVFDNPSSPSSADGLFHLERIPERGWSIVDMGKKIDWFLSKRGFRTTLRFPTETDACLNSFLISEKRTAVVKQASKLVEKRIAAIAIEAIKLLERYHNLGIVYVGSLSRGLTLPTIGGEDLSTLALRQTASYRMFVDPTTQTHLIQHCDVMDTISRSPGELQGFCSTRIDDMYRLSETFISLRSPALIATGPDWTQSKRDLRLVPNLEFPSIARLDALLNEFKTRMFDQSISRSFDAPNYREWIRRFSDLFPPPPVVSGLGHFDSRQFSHIVVIPDVHGDAEYFIKSLWIAFEQVEPARAAHISEKVFVNRIQHIAKTVEFPSGESTLKPLPAPMSTLGYQVGIVQLGDIMDRGPQSFLSYQILASIEISIGWKLIQMFGNHELLIYRPAGFDLQYNTHPSTDIPNAKAMELFAPGGALREYLIREDLVVARIGMPVVDPSVPYEQNPHKPDTLFVHANVDLPWAIRFLESIGKDNRPNSPNWLQFIELLNAHARNDLHRFPDLPGNIGFDDSDPLWSRGLPDAINPDDLADHCNRLDEFMNRVHVSRVIVGHTPEKKHRVINTTRAKCNNKFIITDVAMSRGMSLDGQPYAFIMGLADGGGTLESMKAYYRHPSGHKYLNKDEDYSPK